MPTGIRAAARAGLAAAVTAGGVLLALERVPDRTGPPGTATASPGWRRTNFRGRPVTLAGGPAAGLAGAAGALAAGDRRAALLVLLATAAGGYDDLVAPRREAGADKGLAGHLAAVRAGRVSGGAVKAVSIGAGAWWAVGPDTRGPLDRAVRTVAVAASANLVNLLDLRPGRAGKVVLAAGTAGALARTRGDTGVGGPLAAAAAGAAAAVLPADLGERVVLGDTGANPLGALLGLAAARGGPRTAGVVAAVATALVVASERVSFSAVIARTPALKALDDLGRTAAR